MLDASEKTGRTLRHHALSLRGTPQAFGCELKGSERREDDDRDARLSVASARSLNPRPRTVSAAGVQDFRISPWFHLDRASRARMVASLAARQAAPSGTAPRRAPDGSTPVYRAPRRRGRLLWVARRSGSRGAGGGGAQHPTLKRHRCLLNYLECGNARRSVLTTGYACKTLGRPTTSRATVALVPVARRRGLVGVDDPRLIRIHHADRAPARYRPLRRVAVAPRAARHPTRPRSDAARRWRLTLLS